MIVLFIVLISTYITINCMQEEVLCDEISDYEVLYVANHASFYNGNYIREEEWNGYAHFAKADRSAHLYNLRIDE